MKRVRSKSKSGLPPQMDPPLRRLSTPANGALLKNRRYDPKLKTELNVYNSKYNQMNPYMRTPSYLDCDYPPVIPPPHSGAYSSSTGSSCSSVTYPSTQSSQSELDSEDFRFKPIKLNKKRLVVVRGYLADWAVEKDVGSYVQRWMEYNARLGH